MSYNRNNDARLAESTPIMAKVQAWALAVVVVAFVVWGLWKVTLAERQTRKSPPPGMPGRAEGEMRMQKKLCDSCAHHAGLDRVRYTEGMEDICGTCYQLKRVWWRSAFRHVGYRSCS